MRIGISGASGKLGTTAVKELKTRAPNAQIVGISRTPNKLDALGIEGRFGDFDRPESLTKAFGGLDRLLIIPSSDMQPGVRAKQGREAIERAAEAGVEHIVFMSALGTEAPHLWESYFVPEQAVVRRDRSSTCFATQACESRLQRSVSATSSKLERCVLASASPSSSGSVSS